MLRSSRERARASGVPVTSRPLRFARQPDWIGRFRRFWHSSLDRLDAHLAAVQAAKRTDEKEHS